MSVDEKKKNKTKPQNNLSQFDSCATCAIKSHCFHQAVPGENWRRDTHFCETLRSLFLEGVVGRERIVGFLTLWGFLLLFVSFVWFCGVGRMVDHFLSLKGLRSV